MLPISTVPTLPKNDRPRRAGPGSAQFAPPEAPLWLAVRRRWSCSCSTLAAGHYEDHRSRIYKLRPIHSLNSQLSAAFSVFAANLFGAPVSTTHVVVGSVMGVGAADQYKRVNWGTAREIVVAWVITIPLSAGVSAVTYWILSFLFGLINLT